MMIVKKLVGLCASLALMQSALASGSLDTSPACQKTLTAETAGQVIFGEKSGIIEYDVTDSQQRKVGLTKIINEFEFKGEHYRLISTFVSASGRNQFVSEGRVEGNRLVPKTFSRSLGGHQDFKIEIGSGAVTVTRSSGSPESLPGSGAPGDIVSTLYQAASISRETDVMILDQVNVYGIEKENLSYIGTETLDTRLGSQRVVHVRNKTSATVQDIWIAPAQCNLPIKFTIPAQGMSLVASIAKLKFK